MPEAIALSIYLSIYLFERPGATGVARPLCIARGVAVGRRESVCGGERLNAGSHSRLPTPFLGLWRECVRGPKGTRSASPQVVRRKRPLRRPFPGKRRESPLTAGGGARNISPCAADGRKRRGGALGAPGTLKTGYRGKRIGTRAGPPPAWSRRRSPTRDQFHEEPDPGLRPSFRWLFLYF